MTHLLPYIIGNTKSYTSQRFRCKSCSAKYRRMPIKAVCLKCGGQLQPSVTRGSVEKYLQLGLRLSAKYDVGDYLRSRFVLASEELATLFKPEGHQSDINDYFDQVQELPLQETLATVHKTAEPKPILIAEKKTKPLEQQQTTLF